MLHQISAGQRLSDRTIDNSGTTNNEVKTNIEASRRPLPPVGGAQARRPGPGLPGSARTTDTRPSPTTTRRYGVGSLYIMCIR